MKRLLLAGGALALTAGCAGYHADNPSQISDTVTRTLSGHPAGDFFLKYGPPVGEASLDDGGHIYRWASAYPPAMPARYVMQSYPGGDGKVEYDRRPDGFEGIATTHYCEVRLYTDREDVIWKIAVAVDTIGKWSASRCGELLYSRV